MAKRISWRRLVAFSLAACGGSTTGGVPGVDGGTTSSGPDAAVSPSDADGAVPEAGAPVDAPCTSCIGKSLSWGDSGGLVVYVDTSALAPCRTFTRTRTGRVADGGPSSCSTEIGDCGGASVAIGDVEAALANPDVQRALASPTTPVYGVDTRPVDGSVFEITLGGKSIDIGSDCAAGAKGCVPIPPGVSTLERVLQALDSQELAKPACAAFSHP
jgi:hypothetical protein